MSVSNKLSSKVKRPRIFENKLFPCKHINKLGLRVDRPLIFENPIANLFHVNTLILEKVKELLYLAIYSGKIYLRTPLLPSELTFLSWRLVFRTVSILFGG